VGAKVRKNVITTNVLLIFLRRIYFSLKKFVIVKQKQYFSVLNKS